MGRYERGGKEKPSLKKNQSDSYKKKEKPQAPADQKSSKKNTEKTSKSEPQEKKEGMRLNRYIANAGVCSRRDADKLIANGEVTVNGKVITELGTIVSITDKIIHQGNRLNAEKKVYLLLNKPKDVVTTREDPHAKITVMDIIKGACTERINPVGRLDKQTTGLLLFTNDGDLTKKLTHPKYDAKKIYHVHTDKAVTAKHLQQLADGISLEDGPISADVISYVDGDKTQIGVEIHSGRNRIVRRMFEYFDYKVTKLDRVYFAGLTKQGIPRGKWRFLTPKEVMQLKSGYWK